MPNKLAKTARRKFKPEFKTNVVLECLNERYSTEELARKYDIHSTQINVWKKEFLSKAASVFETATEAGQKGQDSEDETRKTKAHSRWVD